MEYRFFVIRFCFFLVLLNLHEVISREKEKPAFEVMNEKQNEEYNDIQYSLEDIEMKTDDMLTGNTDPLTAKIQNKSNLRAEANSNLKANPPLVTALGNIEPLENAMNNSNPDAIALKVQKKSNLKEEKNSNLEENLRFENSKTSNADPISLKVQNINNLKEEKKSNLETSSPLVTALGNMERFENSRTTNNANPIALKVQNDVNPMAEKNSNLKTNPPLVTTLGNIEPFENSKKTSANTNLYDTKGATPSHQNKKNIWSTYPEANKSKPAHSLGKEADELDAEAYFTEQSTDVSWLINSTDSDYTTETSNTTSNKSDVLYPLWTIYYTSDKMITGHILLIIVLLAVEMLLLSLCQIIKMLFRNIVRKRPARIFPLLFTVSFFLILIIAYLIVQGVTNTSINLKIYK